MNKINELILKKLENYDANTVEIGKKAVELAEIYPEQAIAEQLDSFVKKLVKSGTK